MKHPALTRVFSVALAVLCLVLLLTGAVCIGKTLSARQSDIDEAAVLSDRTADYRTVTEALTGRMSYTEAKQELDERQAQHDKKASEHKTELATYTATKGGINAGSSALSQAQSAMNQGQAQYDAAEAEFQRQSAAFEEGYQQYLAGKQELEQGWAQYNTLSSIISAAHSQLGNLKNMGEILDSDDENARLELTLAAYDGALSAYDQAMEILNNLVLQGTLTQEQLQQLSAAIAGVTGMTPEAIRASVQNARDSLAQGGEGIAISDAEFQLIKTAYSANRALITQVIEAIDGKVNEYDATLKESYAKLTAAQQQLDQAETAMAAGKSAIEEGAAALAQVKAQLEQGQTALDEGWEQIWYQLAKLTEQKEKLKLEKQELEDDAAELETLGLSVDQQKELEQQEVSLRVKLMSRDGVAQRVDGGMELINASEEYQTEFLTQSRQAFILRLCACILMLLSAAAGFAGIPAAYEKCRSRLMLILPPALCLGFAAAAELILELMGRGSSYSALAVIVFAALQLLTVIPRQKPKKIAEASI